MARHDSSSDDDDDSSAPRKRPRLDSASDGDDSHARRRARKAERKAAKKAKKAEKKERKRAKKAARRRDGADEPDVYLGAAAAAAPPAPPPPEPARAPSPQPDPPKKTGRAAFFASLHAAESEKAPVGTFHATGKFKEELEAENDRSGDWACTKCHYTNFKECLTCARCRSLRRFEGRNQASGYCQ